MATRKYASNAEKQRAYRERQRNVTKPQPKPPSATILTSLEPDWAERYGPEAAQRLMHIVATWGIDAAWMAAGAIFQAVERERAWLALSGYLNSFQGHNLKVLVDRNDPLIVQFFEATDHLVRLAPPYPVPAGAAAPRKARKPVQLDLDVYDGADDADA
jgi:hypothetical protein